MEDKSIPASDEVMKKVAGGSDDVITEKWTCPSCCQTFTFCGTEEQIRGLRRLHTKTCGRDPGFTKL